jgi:hypothetical protein
MRVVSVVIRFTQLLAIVPVALGLANAGSFFRLLNGLAQGQPWNFPEFATRLAAFSAPTALGLALMLGLQLLLRSGQVAHARSLRFPEQPWLWKPMWAERRIRLSNRGAVALYLALLGIFAFVFVPVGLWMKSQKPDVPVYTGLGVVGLFLLALVRMTWLNRRWGQSELEIVTLPGVIGGPFRGTVILSESLPDGTAVRVTLNCMRVRTVRMYPSGDRESTTDVNWQDQKILVTAPSMSRPDGVAIPCSFAIPNSCEPTSLDTIGFSSSPGSDPDEHISIYWQLSVGMKDPLDLREVTFEIPVFRTETSSPNYSEDVAAVAPYIEPVEVNALLESIPLEREYSASGQRLRFRMFRRRDFLLLLVFTLAVTLGVWAIFRYVSMPIAFFAAFLPGALAIFSYVALVQSLTWQAEIEITADATTFTAGYIWSRRRYEFPRGKLPRLECRTEIRRQSGSTYAVRMVPAQGPPCDLVKRLDGKQKATAVRDWLMKELWASPPT